MTRTQSLTVGVGTVMDAKEVLILITGASKAIALYKVREAYNDPLPRLLRRVFATCGRCPPSSSTPTP